MSRIDTRAPSLRAHLPEVGELRPSESLAPDSTPSELALLALAPSLPDLVAEPVAVPSAAALVALATAAERLHADPSAPPEVRDAMQVVRSLLVLRDEVASRRRGGVTP